MSEQRRAAMCAWVEANGLDPDTIDEWVTVTGDMINYRQIVDTDGEGNPVWEDRQAPMTADFPVDEYRLSSR